MLKNKSSASKGIIILVLAVLFLAGCSEPTNQVYFKKPVVWNGYFNNGMKCFSTRVDYKYLHFGLSRSSSNRNTYIDLYGQQSTFEPIVVPELYVELEEGKMVYLPDITVEYIKSNWNWQPNGDYGDIVRWYRDSGYHWCACLKGDKLIGFDPPVSIVAIWNKDRTRKYPIPLSYEEVVELFGEPDHIIEYGGT